MKIRTLIVDDEPLARERLRAMLDAETDIEVIGECSSGSEAVEEIQTRRPDLVFLDVQMPELNGFEVLQALESPELLSVIFVTAYDKFALQAFEVHALDYLLKPFDRERLRKALEHARRQVGQEKKQEIHQQLSSLLADLGARKPESKHADRIAVKCEGRVLLIRANEIDWIEAADNYVSIHVGQDAHLHRETMSALESKLSPEQFLRISRSAIVNVERIKELQPMFHGDYVILLRNGAKLTLSRNYRDKLHQLLGKSF